MLIEVIAAFFQPEFATWTDGPARAIRGVSMMIDTGPGNREKEETYPSIEHRNFALEPLVPQDSVLEHRRNLIMPIPQVFFLPAPDSKPTLRPSSPRRRLPYLALALRVAAALQLRSSTRKGLLELGVPAGQLRL